MSTPSPNYARTLAELHEIIAALEAEGMYREASEAHDVFVRVAGKKEDLLKSMLLAGLPLVGGKLYDTYVLGEGQKPAMTAPAAKDAAKPVPPPGYEFVDENDPYLPKNLGSKPVYVDTDQEPFNPAENAAEVGAVIQGQTDIDDQTPKFPKPFSPRQNPQKPALPSRVSPAAPRPALPKAPVKPKPQPAPVEKGTFEQLMGFSLPAEGGFANRPKAADPGGRTNMGITQRTYNAWLKMHGEESRDVKGITREEVEQIYKELYWDKIKGDKLPEDLATVLGDYAIHASPKKAVQKLQQVIGVTPTGNMGPVTLKTVQQKVRTPQEDEMLALKINELREKVLREKKHAKHNPGWWPRLERLDEYIKKN